MIVNLRHLVITATMAVSLFATPIKAVEDAPSLATAAVPVPAQTAPAPLLDVNPRPAPTCISDWSQAGPIVRKEGLATIEKVGRLARDRASVEIVNSVLCKSEERYVYRLTVRGSQGTLRMMVVDARQPFAPPSSQPAGQ